MRQSPRSCLYLAGVASHFDTVTAVSDIISACKSVNATPPSNRGKTSDRFGTPRRARPVDIAK